MVWCCFGRRKWAQRVWSPDGAAQLTEISPTFSTTSLIPSANPQYGGLQRPSASTVPTAAPSAADEQASRGRAGRVAARAVTFPSLASPHHAVSQPGDLHQHPNPAHCHPAAISSTRRMSGDLPVRSTSTPVDPVLESRSRPRPRPQSVPASREMAPANASSTHVYQTRSRRGLAQSMSSTNLPAAVGGRLRSAARSVNNLHELGAQNSSFYDRLSSRLNEVIDQIDHEIFNGGEYIYDPNSEQFPEPQRAAGPVTTARNLAKAASGSSVGTNSFVKVWLYSNSRLPPYLPPLKIYMPTYPLLCLAARYSLRVYDKPTGKEREDHIKASLLHRTKAMTLKSVPVDDMNTIVFAIRGSSSFLDWAVNFRPAPSSPEGFLDDHGNLVHAGFLDVAKGMIKPVAARLRTLLAENPSRSTCSLLITGHSAGGAVAQLLYAHMQSKTDSELSYLTGFFKRVHCVTFGTPPVALLPLTVPRSLQNRKSLFFSFVNEGDPVSRADPAIVRSLLKLYASPSPTPQKPSRPTFQWTNPSTWAAESYSQGPTWKVPNATFSLAGRVIVLRPKYDGAGVDDIEAVTATDELLRDTVFGDPACHTMTMYSKRIEAMATKAVTVGGV